MTSLIFALEYLQSLRLALIPSQQKGQKQVKSNDGLAVLRLKNYEEKRTKYNVWNKNQKPMNIPGIKSKNSNKKDKKEWLANRDVCSKLIFCLFVLLLSVYFQRFLLEKTINIILMSL